MAPRRSARCARCPGSRSRENGLHAARAGGGGRHQAWHGRRRAGGGLGGRCGEVHRKSGFQLFDFCAVQRHHVVRGAWSSACRGASWTPSARRAPRGPPARPPRAAGTAERGRRAGFSSSAAKRYIEKSSVRLVSASLFERHRSHRAVAPAANLGVHTAACTTTWRRRRRRRRRSATKSSWIFKVSLL